LYTLHIIEKKVMFHKFKLYFNLTQRVKYNIIYIYKLPYYKKNNYLIRT